MPAGQTRKQGPHWEKAHCCRAAYLSTPQMHLGIWPHSPRAPSYCPSLLPNTNSFPCLNDSLHFVPTPACSLAESSLLLGPVVGHSKFLDSFATDLSEIRNEHGCMLCVYTAQWAIPAPWQQGDSGWSWGAGLTCSLTSDFSFWWSFSPQSLMGINCNRLSV